MPSGNRSRRQMPLGSGLPPKSSAAWALWGPPAYGHPRGVTKHCSAVPQFTTIPFHQIPKVAYLCLASGAAHPLCRWMFLHNSPIRPLIYLILPSTYMCWKKKGWVQLNMNITWKVERQIWEAGTPIHFFITDYPGLLFTQWLTWILIAFHSTVTPAQQLWIQSLHRMEECDLLFGLLQFMSQLASGSLKHFSSKDISHHKNERSVPSMFLSFVAEGLILLYIVINPAARAPLPWWAWDGQDDSGSLFKAQAHFSPWHHYLPCSSGQWQNLLSCATHRCEEALGKRLRPECRSWLALASPWVIKLNHSIYHTLFA